MPVASPLSSALSFAPSYPLIGRGGASAPSFSDFEYDADTYYWDFETDIANANLVGDNGDDTLWKSQEVISAKKPLLQYTKDYAPLVDANGIKFNAGTDRSLQIQNPTFCNGTSGFYVACNAYKSKAGIYIFGVSNDTSSTFSRCQFQVAGNNMLGLLAGQNDGNAAWQAYGQSLVDDTWYTLEAQLIADGATANPCTLWVNGSEVSYGYRNSSTFAQFEATDPKYAIMGNDYNTNVSYDGGINRFVWQNSVPSESMRTSISTYLNSVRPT